MRMNAWRRGWRYSANSPSVLLTVAGLTEAHARRAKELGVKLVSNTDSHADDQLEYLR